MKGRVLFILGKINKYATYDINMYWWRNIKTIASCD